MRPRTTVALAAAWLVSAAACGPAEVVVSIEIDVPDPDGDGTITRPLSDIEIQLLPFDRDHIFDSLTTLHGVPEPETPAELVAARDEVRRAQETWQTADARWSTVRDTLLRITETMESYSRGEARYVALFREFQDFEAELQAIERERNRLFARFNELQSGTIRASDSIRILKEGWADEAFADVDAAFLAAQRASGLDVAVDTTGADGVATDNLRVKPGTYWVHARYPLSFTELYWNVRIDAVRGEPVRIRLTRENAQEREKL